MRGGLSAALALALAATALRARGGQRAASRRRRLGRAERRAGAGHARHAGSDCLRAFELREGDTALLGPLSLRRAPALEFGATSATLATALRSCRALGLRHAERDPRFDAAADALAQGAGVGVGVGGAVALFVRAAARRHRFAGLLQCSRRFPKRTGEGGEDARYLDVAAIELALLAGWAAAMLQSRRAYLAVG